MTNISKTYRLQFNILVLICLLPIFGYSQPENYGRIYNVQDYIDVTNIQNPIPNNDLLGIRRCFSEVNQHIYNNSTAVVTIIFPRRQYLIEEAIMPIGSSSTIFERLPALYDFPVKINIIGLEVDNTAFKTFISSQPSAPSTFTTFIGPWLPWYTNPSDPAYNYISHKYYENGFDINLIPNASTINDINNYIETNIAQTNVTCNQNPASNNFLSSSPTDMPEIISINPNAHYFFALRGKKVTIYTPNQYDPITYPPDFILTPPIGAMADITIRVSGFKLTGQNSTTNSAVYNIASNQHDINFNSGKAICLFDFKGCLINNNIIQNMYGNGIFINNKEVAFLNNDVIVNHNIILNVWALKYRKTSSQNYDDNGDGISFDGINGGQCVENIVHNDVSVTKQFGRVGLVTCGENDMNCITSRNSVRGYDRAVHVENGRSGHTIDSNRLTGSETGIVFDGNRDYSSPYCPAARASHITNNYISNEGLSDLANTLTTTEFQDLQKIYPPQLFFSSQTFPSNEYLNSNIENNRFVINKNDILQYSHNNTSNFDLFPRPYEFADNVPRYHIHSGIRKQQIICNYFLTLNPSANSNILAGGTELFSYCTNDGVLNQEPCSAISGIPACTDMFNTNLPIIIRRNAYIDCAALYFLHGSSSAQSMEDNFINNQPYVSGTWQDATEYT